MDLFWKDLALMELKRGIDPVQFVHMFLGILVVGFLAFDLMIFISLRRIHFQILFQVVLKICKASQ